MVNKDMISYAFIIIGVIILLTSLKPVQSALSFILPNSFSTPIALIIGVVVIMLGLGLSGKDKPKEEKKELDPLSPPAHESEGQVIAGNP